MSKYKGDQQTVDLDDFVRIFMLSILKDCFMTILGEVGDQDEKRDISLSAKIESFQREKMFAALKDQRNEKVNSEQLNGFLQKMKTTDNFDPQTDMFYEASGLKEGIEVINQHMRNRDYGHSRMVIDSLHQWKETRATNKMPSMAQFMNDPLGEKRKLQNIETLNDELKAEIFDHRLNMERAKSFSQDIGLDGKKRQFGRKGEFSGDERFAKLFK